MFVGGSSSAEIDSVFEETAWRRLHERIKAAGREETALKARIVDLLLEADETKLFRRMGYPTIHAYVEGELGYAHHTATEHMRVAHELVELPHLAAEFRAGDLAWTSVRELTRVVTPRTEEAWLEAVADQRTSRVVEMLRGKGKGDLPGDPVDPQKVRYRIVLEVSAEEYAMHKQARIAVADQHEGPCGDGDFVRAYAAAVMSPAPVGDAPPRPAYQLAATKCSTCKAGHIVAAGMEVPITPAQLALIECDHEYIGDLELDAIERVTSAIPASIRRKVHVRDKCRCVVPGCRSTRHLSQHHIEFREHGGGHEMANLITLCDAHHEQLHDGASRSRKAPMRSRSSSRPARDRNVRSLTPERARWQFRRRSASFCDAHHDGASRSREGATYAPAALNLRVASRAICPG